MSRLRLFLTLSWRVSPRRLTDRWKLYITGAPDTLYAVAPGFSVSRQISNGFQPRERYPNSSVPVARSPDFIRPSKFRFGPNYPLESPEVVFTENIPVHPHLMRDQTLRVQVYSNGHICLDILYSHWTPIQTVASVCLSIQSMLSSCVKKERPPDDSAYVKTARKSPKDTSWSFHGSRIFDDDFSCGRFGGHGAVVVYFHPHIGTLIFCAALCPSVLDDKI
ncbi:MAG: hypothetical protein BJ554DRAFT_5797 [Olpidium bornovanus]|uniref:UBC core domain-containing protein n=1 Tax=Olpidium bornovanus TaxID=278681 RepID=A0A8H7ZYK7_9FUNG|nr:MAG: hypothetical protein BJ554DRAFT_5797 [Olpidium bornovanus]